MQHALSTPSALPKPHWPAETPRDLKEAIIANRKYILEDVKALFSGQMEAEKFMSIRATSDISFEDPLERFEGAQELAIFFKMCQYLDGVSIKIHNTVHSAHEMLLDWEIEVIFLRLLNYFFF